MIPLSGAASAVTDIISITPFKTNVLIFTVWPTPIKTPLRNQCIDFHSLTHTYQNTSQKPMYWFSQSDPHLSKHLSETNVLIFTVPPTPIKTPLRNQCIDFHSPTHTIKTPLRNQCIDFYSLTHTYQNTSQKPMYWFSVWPTPIKTPLRNQSIDLPLRNQSIDFHSLTHTYQNTSQKPMYWFSQSHPHLSKHLSETNVLIFTVPPTPIKTPLRNQCIDFHSLTQTYQNTSQKPMYWFSQSHPNLSKHLSETNVLIFTVPPTPIKTPLRNQCIDFQSDPHLSKHLSETNVLIFTVWQKPIKTTPLRNQCIDFQSQTYQKNSFLPLGGKQNKHTASPPAKENKTKTNTRKERWKWFLRLPCRQKCLRLSSTKKHLLLSGVHLHISWYDCCPFKCNEWQRISADQRLWRYQPCDHFHDTK